MMKNIIVILFFYYATVTYGQVNTKLSLIRGVWEYTFPNEAGSETGSVFKIINDKKCLEFTYIPDSDEISHPLFRMIVGFQDSINSSYEHEEIDKNDFKADGLYYTEIISEENIAADGLVEKPNFIVSSYFECDRQLLSMNGTKLFEYDKIPELPYEAVKYLFRRGKRDERNYLKEYLNLKVLAIKSAKCTVYSKPDKQTNVRLNREDLIIITEQAGRWLKVKFSESGVGWIKREDVKKIACFLLKN